MGSSSMKDGRKDTRDVGREAAETVVHVYGLRVSRN